MSSNTATSGDASCHGNDDTTSPHHPHTHDHHHHDAETANLQELIIEGAGCASCVGKIESALNAVPGVEKAEMNFAMRTVSVEGTAPADALVNAVEKAGYNAKIATAEHEDDALAEKEQADWAYYKRLMRDMTIALSVGVPLMIYGIVGGAMTVNRGPAGKSVEFSHFTSKALKHKDFTLQSITIPEAV